MPVGCDRCTCRQNMDTWMIRTLAESWVICWIHKTPEMVGCTRTTATGEDNGAVAEALNALGLEHPGDVIIDPKLIHA